MGNGLGDMSDGNEVYCDGDLHALYVNAAIIAPEIYIDQRRLNDVFFTSSVSSVLSVVGMSFVGSGVVD